MHLQIGADIDPEIIHFGIATWTADGEIFTSLVYEFKPVADIHPQTVFETTKDGNTCIAHFEINRIPAKKLPFDFWPKWLPMLSTASGKLSPFR